MNTHAGDNIGAATASTIATHAASGAAGITVTVCIANYNGMAVIDDCLRSVLAQILTPEADDPRAPPIKIDIIVHDDASTDDSPAHVRRHYPQVRLIAATENVGFCIANNRMVAAAAGDYLLLLNNDAALYPDALRTLARRARELARPAVLGLPQHDAANGALIDIGSTFDPFLNPIPDLRPTPQEAGMIIGACLWLPRVLWNDIGGFPEWFDSLAEDMYLCCVARLYGHPVEALRASGFRHWVGASLGGGKVLDNRLSTTSRRRILSERNKCYVMVLCYPAPLLQLVLPVHLVLLMVEGAILAALKCSSGLFTTIYLNVPISLWRERRRLVRDRQAIQSGRRISAAAFFTPFQWMPHKLRLLLRHGMPEIR